MGLFTIEDNNNPMHNNKKIINNPMFNKNSMNNNNFGQ